MNVRHAREGYEHARDAAVEAALQASHLIRRHAGHLQEEMVRHKGVNDLVTAIDEEVQHLVAGLLRGAFPDYTVLAEEGADLSDASTAAAGHRWIIDPIDGTTNFAHGVPPYAVSIALQREGRSVVGVVLDVARGELFTAVRGQGTFLNGRRVQVSRTPALPESLIATGFPYRRFRHIDAYLSVFRAFLLESRGVRRHGVASIDLAYVACGRFDGFFETGLLPWDVAAGMLLVEEAGGRVTDYVAAPDPVFAQQIVASNGHIHEDMLSLLEPMREIRL